jgi:hypothetical protein
MADTPPPDHAGFVHALKVAADNVGQHLARSSGLEVGQVAILVYLDLHQPATLPPMSLLVSAEGTAGPRPSWQTFGAPDWWLGGLPTLRDSP